MLLSSSITDQVSSNTPTSVWEPHNSTLFLLFDIFRCSISKTQPKSKKKRSSKKLTMINDAVVGCKRHRITILMILLVDTHNAYRPKKDDDFYGFFFSLLFDSFSHFFQHQSLGMRSVYNDSNNYFSHGWIFRIRKRKGYMIVEKWNLYKLI